MNLVGKIFVVLIFVMSLVFMAFAMAVYATHRNWREEVTRPRDKAGPGREVGLQYQLSDAKAENENLKNERDTAIKDREAEKNAKVKALTTLQNEYDLQKNELNDLQKGYATEKKDTREAVAGANASLKNATDNFQELEKQRTAVVEAQQDRDKYFKDLVQKDDELNQAKNDLEQLQKRNKDLAADLAKYKELARYVGAPSPDSDYKSKTPPQVDGVVTATPGNGLVEISLGSDQGLRKGHRLEVYRIGGGQNVYVGKIEVVRTAATTSVCKIDPKYQNSNITVGDRVASRLE